MLEGIWVGAMPLWQLAQNVLPPQNIDRLQTAPNRDMLNIYVRIVSWQNLSVLRPRFNPLIHFYSKSNFPIFHQVLYRNLQIRPQKWVSHWFLTKKKKKLYPKKFQIAKVIPQKRNFSTFDFIFQIWEPSLARNNKILWPNQTQPFKGQQHSAVYIVTFSIVHWGGGEGLVADGGQGHEDMRAGSLLHRKGKVGL